MSLTSLTYDCTRTLLVCVTFHRAASLAQLSSCSHRGGACVLVITAGKMEELALRHFDRLSLNFNYSFYFYYIERAIIKTLGKKQVENFRIRDP